jgi:di/tricarboxylate transporter
MIPLSYAAIMGGTLTLIGTSTNLLVDGVARSQGMAPFTIFEITPIGLVAVAWGMVYLALIGRDICCPTGTPWRRCLRTRRR